jgi:hypothetical protein
MWHQPYWACPPESSCYHLGQLQPSWVTPLVPCQLAAGELCAERAAGSKSILRNEGVLETQLWIIGTWPHGHMLGNQATVAVVHHQYCMRHQLCM